MNNKNDYGRKKGNVLKGVIAGVAGGIAASFLMNEFQAAWSAISEKMEDSASSDDRQTSDKADKAKQKKEAQEPAMVKAPEMVFENVSDHELTKQEKNVPVPPSITQRARVRLPFTARRWNFFRR